MGGCVVSTKQANSIGIARVMTEQSTRNGQMKPMLIGRTTSLTQPSEQGQMRLKGTIGHDATTAGLGSQTLRGAQGLSFPVNAVRSSASGHGI